MKLSHIFAFVAATFLSLPLSASPRHSLTPDATLWYESPADIWQATLPLGNGRLGAMPDGGIRKEKIVLNEISMWSGSEQDYSNPEAADSLPVIRRLLLEGRNDEAQRVMYEHFVPHKPETGGTYGAYQMLADLDISYSYPGLSGEAADYLRLLDLTDGVSETTFSIGGVEFTRTYSVPRGHDAIVIAIEASRPGAVNFSCAISRPERATLTVDSSLPALILSGNLDSGCGDSIPGVGYQAMVGAKTRGGTVSLEGDSLVIRGADKAWIAVTAATSYFFHDDYSSLPRRHLIDALVSDLDAMMADGSAAHRSLMQRASVSLPLSSLSSLPTDSRIIALDADPTSDDPALAALYYNYGRYLLISSTLPGFLPPNLQGLWANECMTPWNGDYHTNINVQMNHWPAEQGNLSELHLPLVELVRRSIPSGERTARAFYGPDARGWVMHMMTNVWNYTEPGEHPSWGATNTGGAWLCQHLWEHFLFSGDMAYLADVYPMLRGASEFFLSTMIEEPSHSWLVTAPSSSPENMFRIPGYDGEVSVCMGPTMDTQIIHELFTNTATAASILGIDKEFSDTLRATIDRLPPMQIGPDGRLMEWLEPYEEVDPHHRHVSHLYGLHPGNMISTLFTPDLAEACRRTLDVRGDEGTGWSRAWKVNFWARLADGNRAYSIWRGLLEPAVTPTHHRSGTFPNLFCSHPPFQMDGNWGGASGIGEMLLQSQDGFINLLPALPDSWSEGSFHGLKVRGGAEIDLVWKDSRPVSVTVTGGYLPEHLLRIPDDVTAVIASDGTPLSFPAQGLVSIPVSSTPLTLNFLY